MISKYQTDIAAYRVAYASHAKAENERDAMQKRLNLLTEERQNLRARVVETPELATDAKMRGQLAVMFGDHEMAGAALEGLTLKEIHARAAAAHAAQPAMSPMPGHFGQARQWRQAHHGAAMLALLESWGPAAPGARLAYNPSDYPEWCRHCVEGKRLLRTLIHSDVNLIGPDILQAAVDFLAAEFEELTPPGEVATVPVIKAAA